jgi:hypothetical protein
MHNDLQGWNDCLKMILAILRKNFFDFYSMNENYTCAHDYKF